MEKKSPNGSSTGEHFAASCILLSKGNGTISCQEVQTQESKTINSINADTLIPVVIRIRDFKFRRIHTHSWLLCKLTSEGVKIDIR